jgi:hypothetical protein
MNIVGAIMVHDDEKYTQMVLDDLSKYTDSIYVNLNDPTDICKEIVKNHNNVVEVIETSNKNGKWSQGLQRDNTIRMLDNVKPDIVLFPDSDEKYPPNMTEQLEVFYNDKEKMTFWFRLMYMWGEEDKFRNDGLFKSIHHVRAFRWIPGITFLPKYAGYACPTNYINLPKNTRYHSTLPTLHYGYMHEEDRIRKYKRGNCDYCNEDIRDKMDKDKLIRTLPQELQE